MLNKKFINIGSFVLMIYCIYEFRTTNNIKMSENNVYSGAKAKYSINWDIDDSKPNKSITERVLSYAFSDKINAIKGSVKKGNTQADTPLETAAIGDEVSLTYTITQEDNTSESDAITNFVLHHDDPLTQFLVNMEPNRDKTLLLRKEVELPSFIKITGQTAKMVLTIKSLTKANN